MCAAAGGGQRMLHKYLLNKLIDSRPESTQNTHYDAAVALVEGQ